MTGRAANDVLELAIATYRYAPNPVFVRAIIADLDAAGLVIVPKADVLLLRALRAAGAEKGDAPC